MLELEGITKRYGPFLAVDDVSASFAPGEIHFVIGENGAGKSTLLKVGAGLVTPDEGAVSVFGTKRDVAAPNAAKEAIRLGVGMVQQHFALVDVFPVLDNLMLGAEPVRGFGRLDREAARRRAHAVIEELGVELPLDALTGTLGVGDRQRLEIARVLFRDAKILILDEPTAVLTVAEAAALYAMLRRLAEKGRAVVVVTHKLDEVLAHADQVTVMRRGRRVESRKLDTARGPDEAKALARGVMGADPPGELPQIVSTLGDVVLEVKGAHKAGSLAGVDLTVRAREVVGVAGIEGNGQRELVRVIAGLDRLDRGLCRAPGGAAVVHEDRHREGLVLEASLTDNLLLGELASFTGTMGILDGAEMQREAEARAKSTAVPDYVAFDQPAASLSGGNQQKLVVARILARIAKGAKLLVLSHPTRGVDLGASRTIYEAILAVVERHRIGVLVVSSDLHELRALSHRLVVMAKGRVVAELPRTASDEAIGEKMLGGPGDRGLSGEAA